MRTKAGATVKVYEDIGYLDGMPLQTVTADGEGYFSTGYLKTGAYTFVVEKEGYETRYFYEPIVGGVARMVPNLELERKEG